MANDEQTTEAGASPLENGYSHQREIAAHRKRIRDLMTENERLRAFAQFVANTTNDRHLYDEAMRLGASR